MSCELLLVCSLVATTAGATARVPVGPGVYHATRDRDVAVARFALDVTPVTNDQFRAFVVAAPAWRRGAVDPLFADAGYLAAWAGADELGGVAPDAPVTGVSWFAARAYCAWRGARLPTLAEWEVAAAGAPSAEVLAWYAHPSSAPPRVGLTRPNAWGVRDLYGVVWEWVLDFDADDAVADPARAGRFCGGAAADAADPGDYAAFMRSAFRSALEAAYTTSSLGFRCAADLPGAGRAR